MRGIRGLDFAILLGILVFCNSCSEKDFYKNGDTFVNSKYKISFKLPAHWKWQQSQTEGGWFFKANGRKDDHTTFMLRNMQVTVSEVREKNMIDAFMNNYLKDLEILSNLTVEKNEKCTITGIDAKCLVITHEVPPRRGIRKIVRSLITIVERDYFVYTICVSDARNAFRHHQEDFDLIANSISFIE